MNVELNQKEKKKTSFVIHRKKVYFVSGGKKKPVNNQTLVTEINQIIYRILKKKEIP